MSIEGTITVSALFHDKDGDNRLKIAALRNATEYTSGSVAVVSGTAGISGTTINLADLGYRDASGATASYSSPTFLVLLGTPAARAFEFGVGRISLFSSGGIAACGCPSSSGMSSFSVTTTSGTASYTLLVYKA